MKLVTMFVILVLAPLASAQGLIGQIVGEPGSALGANVGYVGDVDSDGFDDIVADRLWNFFGQPPRLISTLISGRTLSVTPLYARVRPLGDLQGDGLVDVLYLDANEVRSYVGGPVRFSSLPCVDIGDINGDGVRDLVWMDSMGNQNSFYVFSGADGATALLANISSPFPGVARDLGDLNGDGRSEFLIATSADSGNSGAVRVYSGASVLGSFAMDHIAGAASLGDIDGDGVSDFVLASRTGPIQTFSGASRSMIRQVPSLGIIGDISTANDINRDGFKDFCVVSLEGSQAKARVYSGATGGILMIVSNVSFEAVAIADADINRDGFPDLVIGDSLHANGASVSNGRVLLVSGAPTPPLTYCQGKINSLGCEPYVWASGSTSRSGPDNLVVHAANVLNNKLGIMFWGRQGSSAPFLGGTLCISTPFKRTDSQSSGGSSAGSDCSGTFSYAFSQAEMAQNGLGVGSAGYCQFWYRDPGFPPPANVGLTNGVVFTVSF